MNSTEIAADNTSTKEAEDVRAAWKALLSDIATTALGAARGGSTTTEALMNFERALRLIERIDLGGERGAYGGVAKD